MEQVEEICENIALINKGSIILNGSVKDIKQQFKQNLFAIECKDATPVLRDDYFETVIKNDNKLHIRLKHGTTSKDLLKTLVEQDVDLLSYQEVLPTLNEIFIKQVTEQSHE
jgi:ABC-2 type transport system ATP-binding protein